MLFMVCALSRPVEARRALAVPSASTNVDEKTSSGHHPKRWVCHEVVRLLRSNALVIVDPHVPGEEKAETS